MLKFSRAMFEVPRQWRRAIILRTRGDGELFFSGSDLLGYRVVKRFGKPLMGNAHSFSRDFRCEQDVGTPEG